MTVSLEQAVSAVRDQLGQAPQASAHFEAATRLVDGLRTDARVRQFTFTVDEPESMGGSDKGPNPVELVLAALGTCQEIVYATYAAVLGIELHRVEVRVEGELDPRGFYGVAEVPAGFETVRYAVQLESSATPERIAELVNAVNAHCPVLDILTRAIPVIATGVEYNGTPLAATTEAASAR